MDFKKILTTLLAAFMIFGSFTQAFAGVGVAIDGQKVNFTASTGAPFVDSASRTQVPLRAAMESFGCQVSWDNATRTAIVQRGTTTVKVPVGKKYILKNGEKIASDTSALIKDSKTFLPIRPVLEAFGAKVTWDGKNQVVNVSRGGSDRNAGGSSGGGTMTVHFIDVGQGDSTFIDFGSYECLIDAGVAGAGKTVSNYIKPYVDGDIELVIGTHPDADHIGGLTTIFNNYQVDKVIDSGSTSDSKAWQNYHQAALTDVGSNFIYDSDMTISMGSGASITILEGIDGSSNSNDNSVVSLVKYGNISLLLAGDCETAGEAAVAGKVPDVDVFKAGHHGSKTANTSLLLGKAKPEYVIISAGKSNKYGHPHSEALSRIFAAGATAYGTFKSGSIVMTTDGSTYSFNISQALTMSDAGAGSKSSVSNTQPAASSTSNSGAASSAPKSYTAGDVNLQHPYVANTNTHKVHLTSCRYAKTIADHNRAYFDTLPSGYDRCKVCNP